MTHFFLFHAYQELCFFGKSVYFAMGIVLFRNFFVAIQTLIHTRQYIIEREELDRYIQESQDRPFDLKKNHILKHPLIEEIYNGFFESCLLFIQKNSAFTKNGGYLSQDDINTITKRVMQLIKEASYPMKRELIHLSFLYTASILFGILGTLLSISMHSEPLVNAQIGHIGILIFGIINALLISFTRYVIQHRLYSFSQKAKSFFLRLIQATEIQYKRIHSPEK